MPNLEDMWGFSWESLFFISVKLLQRLLSLFSTKSTHFPPNNFVFVLLNNLVQTMQSKGFNLCITLVTRTIVEIMNFFITHNTLFRDMFFKDPLSANLKNTSSFKQIPNNLKPSCDLRLAFLLKFS